MKNDFEHIIRFDVSNKKDCVEIDEQVLLANSNYELSLKKIIEIPFYKVAHSSNVDSQLISSLFYDPVMEEIHFNRSTLLSDDGCAHFIVEISFLPGVTDNSGKSAEEALELIGVKGRVFTGKAFYLYGEGSAEKIKKFAKENFGNELIQKIEVFSGPAYKRECADGTVEVPLVQIDINNDKHESFVELDVSDEHLNQISIDSCLALTLKEMKCIRDFYLCDKTKDHRFKVGLPFWPTKLELEVLAQTWSEHCKHKIFAADINYKEGEHSYKKLDLDHINGLYRSKIKKATKDIEKERGLTWLKSVFSDNAGIVRFDSKVDLCIKAETHNSPSALDPYGGALTGILGVNRDILGCGLGARPIANTNVFCLGSTEWPRKGEEDLMPDGLMEPRHLLKGVHKGVEDGGNKSGVPTVNGAMVFDQDYAGKPLVFCGTVGVMPPKLKDGRESTLKGVKSGDFVIVVGGAVGADGIHGATFSSLELNESSPATAVQIGDPITQKRVSDFLIEARDLGLFTCVTDNGAGGLSSSIGEMATLTNGAIIDLEKCPLKYPGLSPWEIMISESQERMTLAVSPNRLDSFLNLAQRRGVCASCLGEFTDSGFLDVYHGKSLVGQLDLHFLHEGLPAMELKATWDGPRGRNSWINKDHRLALSLKKSRFLNAKEILPKLLNRENVASKAYWVKQYDHEVQAATHIKPFVGLEQKVPGDSGVVWLAPHGGEEDNAVAIGCGIVPRISLYDPYLMAQYSVDEAIRNIVSSGADLDQVCLLDNFCWPDPVKTQKNPDGDYKLGQLVRTCEGLYDICLAYGAPLVSGKDSMKNDFRGKAKNGNSLQISIQPTLLVTAMGRASINSTSTPEFQNSEDLIYMIGGQVEGTLLGSEFDELINDGSTREALGELDLDLNASLYRKIHQAMKNNWLQSCHDISDGGILCAVAEGLFNGTLGASLKFPEGDPLSIFFHEGPGRFVISISKDIREAFETYFKEAVFLGELNDSAELKVCQNEEILIWQTRELYEAWNRKW